VNAILLRESDNVKYLLCKDMYSCRGYMYNMQKKMTFVMIY